MSRLVLISLFIYTSDAVGQQTWSLKQCIDTAVSRNLDVLSSELSVEQNNQDLQAAKWAFMPDLNFGAGQFIQNGRSIDRFTNSFTVQSINSNNFQLQSQAILYAGGRLQNQKKASLQAVQASEADRDFAKQTISFNVANAYLQALQANEQVNVSNANLAATRTSLKRIQLLFDAGSVGQGDLVSLQAQEANDEATLINANNALNSALVNLKLLLQLPGETIFEIENVKLGTVKSANYPITLNELYDTALKYRNDIKAAEIRVLTANSTLLINKASVMPTLSIGATASTVFSSNAKEIINTQFMGTQPIGVVANTGEIVEAPKFTYNVKTIGFAQQLSNNLGSSMGLNLSVPLYNKYQNKAAINKGRIAVKQSELNLKRTQQNLYNEINTAYTNFTNAKARLEANEKSYNLQKINNDLNEKRYEAGRISEFDLQTAKSAYILAEQNYIIAKYNYVFNRLVLDYYAGLPLQI